MARFFKSLFVVILICLGVFFIFSYRLEVTRFFSKSAPFFNGLFRENTDQRKIIELQAEIAQLKFDANTAEERQEDDRYHYKVAEIYSRYPFNDQSVVIINLGSADGMREGMPVFLERGVLFGKVRAVRRTQSDVETIFNTSWKTSVSVGEKNIKAVYVGGPVPMLDFIPKDAVVTPGDAVLNIAPDIPLHASLGTVFSTDPSSYDVWQKAKVSPDFDLNNFHTVLVMLDFP